jgi:hypothetical protein
VTEEGWNHSLICLFLSSSPVKICSSTVCLWVHIVTDSTVDIGFYSGWFYSLRFTIMYNHSSCTLHKHIVLYFENYRSAITLLTVLNLIVNYTREVQGIKAQTIAPRDHTTASHSGTEHTPLYFLLHTRLSLSH